MEAEAPLILDRYRPLGTRGTGASGTVELCWDTRIQRRVAIKRMPLSDRRADGSVPGLAEARTGAMLAHPNIVSVIDFETTDDEALLIMEAIEGPTLAELIDETPAGEFDLDIATTIAESVGSALDFAHENQVLHLDIKPENILITRGGVAKVSDFGISELADAQGFGEASGGTVGYMPPEQARGLDLDQRCDEFALAVVVYEMLTGRSPFMAPTLEASLKLMEDFELVPPSALRDDLAPELDEVLLAALSPNREERFETIYDLMQALAGLLGDATEGTAKLKAIAQAEDEETAPRPRRGRRRGLRDLFGARLVSAAGRAASGLLCWWLAAVALVCVAPAGTAVCLALALLPGVAALAKPQLGALISLVCLGAAAVLSPGIPTPLGLAIVVAAAAWTIVTRAGSSADVNCALVTVPLGIVWFTPLMPLLAGLALTPKRAAIASGLGSLLALALALMTGTGSLLHFGPWLVDFNVVSLSQRTLTSPATWTIILACVFSAVLVSLFCTRSTAVSCTLGAFLGAAVLLGARALERWLQTGGWTAPDLPWTIATLLALVCTIVMGVMGVPRRDEGEN